MSVTRRRGPTANRREAMLNSRLFGRILADAPHYDHLQTPGKAVTELSWGRTALSGDHSCPCPWEAPYGVRDRARPE
jgi:hypothetical protein